MIAFEVLFALYCLIASFTAISAMEYRNGTNVFQAIGYGLIWPVTCTVILALVIVDRLDREKTDGE